MHWELAVPGLLSGSAPGRFPSIERLLARGRRQERSPVGLEAWLMGNFGLEGENVPAGALTLLAGNGFKELIRCWQPDSQRLLEPASLQPRRQIPAALHRQRLG